MGLFKKFFEFKIGWFDVSLTKLAVFGATLMLAKLWPPVLSLEWYWYLIIWVLAAIRPLATVYKWVTTST